MKESADVDTGAENIQKNSAAPEIGDTESSSKGNGATAESAPTDESTGPVQKKPSTSKSMDMNKINVQSGRFSPINSGEGRYQGGQNNIGRLMDLELPIAVELGRIRMLVKDILELGPGSVVELNKFSGEPVDVYVNNKKFAEGEVVVVDQNFGVRITALIGPNERLSNVT